MAQFTSESQPSVALEEASFTASPTHTLVPTASFSPRVSHPLVIDEPRFVFKRWIARSEPATESVTVTTTRASGASFTPPPSQGYVTRGTHPVTASLGLGFQPSG